MARSLLENPNFSWFTWNPTAWTDPVEDTTEDVVTSPGITSMYPYFPVGGDGGTGGDNITPIMPRETDPFAFEDIRALAARGATGAQGVADDDENWLEKRIAFFRDKYPNWATPVGIINALTGRKDATQSFAGGQGGVGSMAGLYQSEVDLLNELLQGKFLVQTPSGVKTTSGKNPVSLLGGYEEGQRETYNLIKSRYPGKTDEEIIAELLGKGYNEETGIVKRFKEAQRQVIADQLKKDRARTYFEKEVHPGTSTTITPTVDFVHEMSEPIPTQPSYSETIGRSGRDPDPPARSAPARSAPSGPPPGGHHGGGGGDRDQSPSSAPDRGSRGRGGHHWAKGGRVRYTNGGIVGLL